MTERWKCNCCGAIFLGFEEANVHRAMYDDCVYASLILLEEKTPDVTNPKDQIGATKLPLGLFPVTAIAQGALAMLEGKLKYGESNYRATPVRASIYLDAALRHLYRLYEGEDLAPDSGISHAGHILACLAIYLDAQAAGTLVDDRKYRGHALVAELEKLTPLVRTLQEKYQDRTPIHYTITSDAPHA